ncbi:MAG TPA: Crp/Fnr family transcriptional regulator [Bdellovibrionota bacterium]|nr:Crp/Fnr family transcriptional regulator [Bdellovibrionota bacterium]
MIPEPRNPFSALTPDELRELEARQELRRFGKGHFLFEVGQPVKGVFCIRTGVVKITQNQGGKPVALRLASEGEWVGHRSIFTSETYRGSAVAKEQVAAHFVPLELLHRLFGQNTAFAHALIRMIAHDLERAERRLLEHQELNVPSRLISLFRSLGERIGIEQDEGRLIQTKLTKVEISEMIGASQEVVSRQLSRWKKEGLVRENGKRIYLSQRLLDRVIR